jgi:serine/threonine-protein kinase
MLDSGFSTKGNQGVKGKAQDDELVMSLVELALGRPPAEREVYLHTACADNSQLFKEVWGYVVAEQRMNGFLLDPLYPPPGEHTFEAGELLEGRFRIVRQVAEGGMGVVYEAIDEKLGRSIAIKSAKSSFQKRLPPEVRHASEISHPNVCKIFEIHTATTDRGQCDFLTMEYLDGETLTQRLRRGPLPEREVRAIASQLCAGLAAAHRNRVIHGDLKSNNVILTAAAGGAVRVVITDFGLARRPDTTQHTIQSGALGGTPDYMAPELWRGEKASVASDIYALGVILYEMVAGRRPFGTTTFWQEVGTSSTEMFPNGSAISWEDRLTSKPSPANPKWDRLLFRCLNPEPARRFASVDELANALAPPSRRWVLAAAAAVTLAGLSAVVTYERVAPAKEMVRLAVLPFETDSENRALADGLLNDAAVRLRQVKNSKSEKMALISLADAVRNRVDKPEKAAKVLGATHVLTGTLRSDGGRVLVHVSLADARSHLPVREWEAGYPLDGLRELPMALAGVVTGTLHLPALAAVAAVNSAAYADFTRGVGLLQRNMADAALPLLERAAKADPDLPLTHARLAEAQLQKYKVTNDARWLDRSILSFGNARQRNPDVVEVWLVSATINEYVGAYETARDDIHRALDIEPLNGEAWRYLGSIYQESGRFADALAAYQKGLEVQPGHFTNYEGLCSLYSSLGNYEEGIPQCLKLVAIAPDFAEAHLTLANAYGNWGHYVEAENESRIALTLDPASSRAFHLLAVTLTYERKFDEALSNFQSALQTGSSNHLLYLNLGIALKWAGRQTEAEEAYRKGLALAKTVLATNSRDGNVRARLAYLSAEVGKRDEAEEAATIARQLSGGSANVLYWLVRTYVALGDRDRATGLAEDAPDETLRRLTRQPDLAEFLSNPRLQSLMQSHHIR